MANRFIEDPNKLGNVVNGWTPQNIVVSRNIVKNTFQLITGASSGYVMTCSDATGTAQWTPAGDVGVTSITSNDSSITVSNPTGTVDLKINTAHSNIWTGLPLLKGSGLVIENPVDVSGVAISNANPAPNPITTAYSFGTTWLSDSTLDYTITFPALATGGQEWRFKTLAPINHGLHFAFPANTLSYVRALSATGTSGPLSGTFTTYNFATGANSLTCDEYLVRLNNSTYYLDCYLGRASGLGTAS
jgi:hypothetical protein